MKRLKPGQLCTIDGHVYRCSKLSKNIFVKCTKCEFSNKYLPCNNEKFNPYNCAEIFGFNNYPILVK